jgi:hypothetical protein
MNKSIIIRAIATGVVILAVNISAQAQLGGAVNRARQAAGQATQSATGTTTQPATTEQPVGETAQPAATAAPAAAQQPRQDLKPSAAAIAADPKASDNTVERGYTKSPAQIRAAYEALDPKIYFQPYYHPQLRKWYWLDLEAQDRFFTASSSMLDEFYRSDRETSFYENGQINLRMVGIGKRFGRWVGDTIPPIDSRDMFKESVGYMPIGIHAMYAGMAFFAADPQAYMPFMKFCEAKLARMAFGSAKLNPDPAAMLWDEVTIKVGDSFSKLPVKWGQLCGVAVDNEFERLEAIAKTIPVPVIVSAASYYVSNLDRFNKAEVYTTTRWYFHLFEIAMYYLTNHPQGKADKSFEQLWSLYRQFQADYKGWVEQEKLNAPPVEMPKTFDMGAALAAKALEQAKKQYAGIFNVDKVVFLSNKWVEYKRPEWPYPVSHRSLDAGFLTKVGDKWQIRYYNFQQMSDGKGGWSDTYNTTAQFGGSEPQNVNYTGN